MAIKKSKKPGNQERIAAALERLADATAAKAAELARSNDALEEVLKKFAPYLDVALAAIMRDMPGAPTGMAEEFIPEGMSSAPAPAGDVPPPGVSIKGSKPPSGAMQ